jgi:hypothetical protein
MSELLLPASLASWPKRSEEWPASTRPQIKLSLFMALLPYVIGKGKKDVSLHSLCVRGL